MALDPPDNPVPSPRGHDRYPQPRRHPQRRLDIRCGTSARAPPAFPDDRRGAVGSIGVDDVGVDHDRPLAELGEQRTLDGGGVRDRRHRPILALRHACKRHLQLC
ncbi:MAG: hypothetical protein R2690_12410 [Acidimicrobiales bacterium]